MAELVVAAVGCCTAAVAAAVVLVVVIVFLLLLSSGLRFGASGFRAAGLIKVLGVRGLI